MRTMKRKDYQKPTVKAVKLRFKCQMLAGSGVPWWGGEGGARGMRRTSIDDDLDCEE